MGNTMLLATVVSAKEAGEGVDFMPLTVEYKEKFSSNGRFPVVSLSAKAVPAITKFLPHVWLTACSVPFSPTIITQIHS